jgi:hypothetical protein
MVDPQYTKTAGRLPGLMPADQVRDEDREAYDRLIVHLEKYTRGKSAVADARPIVDGKPYAYDYFASFTHAADLWSALWAVGRAIQKHQGEPGGYLLTDHVMIDVVLGTDSGYWSFHGGHTANAITAGVRIEAMEALADGREEDLTDDERQQIEFIRAVRDLTMTDDIWNRMVERLGTVRGTIELAYFVAYLMFHQRMMQSFGMAGMEPDDWRALIAEYKDGSRDAETATRGYVFEVLERMRSEAGSGR